MKNRDEQFFNRKINELNTEYVQYIVNIQEKRDKKKGKQDDK